MFPSHHGGFLGGEYGQSGDPDAFAAKLRQVYHALVEYVPQPYSGRITLFRARAQPLFCSHDPFMGWRDLAHGGIDVHEVPGLHAYILKAPFVRVLARALESCLEGALIHPHPAGCARARSRD